MSPPSRFRGFSDPVGQGNIASSAHVRLSPDHLCRAAHVPLLRPSPDRPGPGRPQVTPAFRSRASRLRPRPGLCSPAQATRSFSAADGRGLGCHDFRPGLDFLGNFRPSPSGAQRIGFGVPHRFAVAAQPRPLRGVPFPGRYRGHRADCPAHRAAARPGHRHFSQRGFSPPVGTATCALRRRVARGNSQRGLWTVGNFRRHSDHPATRDMVRGAFSRGAAAGRAGLRQFFAHRQRGPGPHDPADHHGDLAQFARAPCAKDPTPSAPHGGRPSSV